MYEGDLVYLGPPSVSGNVPATVDENEADGAGVEVEEAVDAAEE